MGTVALYSSALNYAVSVQSTYSFLHLFSPFPQKPVFPSALRALGSLVLCGMTQQTIFLSFSLAKEYTERKVPA